MYLYRISLSKDNVGAVTNEYPGMFVAGITTLVVGLIVLIPGTIFVIRKSEFYLSF